MNPKFFKAEIEGFEKGLEKTRSYFTRRIKNLLSPTNRLDESLFEHLEEILITSDVGIKTTNMLLEDVRSEARKMRLAQPDQLILHLQKAMIQLLSKSSLSLPPAPIPPYIILVVGVNGVGKTTSIAKLAYRYRNEGKKVLLAAADTFRPSAIEQLQYWAELIGCTTIKQLHGSDPAAVAFDSVKAAQSRGIDVLIIDSAGRFHTKKALMEELKKIKRIISREQNGAPHEILLTLDATTGQNALTQTRIFHEAVEVSGIILTKLDGTARGGIVLAIGQELEIPIRYISTGEGIEDLKEFSAQAFVLALFS